MRLIGNLYKPGIRNISEAECERRQETSIISLVLALIVFTFLTVIGSPAIMYLLLLPFLWMGILSYIQSKFKFCVTFAMKGIHNARQRHSEPQQVLSDVARLEDRKRATQLLLQSGIIALLITAGFVFIM